jgi:hypothetical protein
MAELDAILQEAEPEIGRIGAADLVVGLPTYNNRNTLDHVVEAVVEAFSGSLRSRRCAIVNADGGSRDGTAERLKEVAGGRAQLVQVRYPVYPVRKLSPPLAGVPGRQEALKTLFLVARRLGAGACAVLDADLLTLEPDWIESLLTPIVKDGFDLVAPCHLRHKYEGAISSGIAYPFLRALYGKRLRQPVGADLAVSARLMEFFSESEEESARPLPLDDWTITPALIGPFQICQTFLGPRSLNPKGVAPELSATLAQLLAVLFEEMDRTASHWQKVRGSRPVPSFGPPCTVTTEPAPVNVARMMESFRLGSQDLHDIWRLVLPPATLFSFMKLARRSDSDFQMADDDWARTVYDFAVGYRLRVIDRTHLLRAFTPIYLGWAGSFFQEIHDAAPDDVEARQEQLCLAFEAQKRYLISRWRWPDRFNP